MTVQKQREIVIEFEKVQTIRKRARTHLADCRGCGIATDAISLIDAADLFEIARDQLFQFISRNGCHYHIRNNEDIYLCVPSLLSRMTEQRTLRLLPTEEGSR